MDAKTKASEKEFDRRMTSMLRALSDAVVVQQNTRVRSRKPRSKVLDRWEQELAAMWPRYDY